MRDASTLDRWLQRVWIFLLVSQTILLASAITNIVRGTPDHFTNQHERLAAAALTGMGLALGYLVSRMWLKFVALAVAVAALVWNVSLGI